VLYFLYRLDDFFSLPYLYTNVFVCDNKLVQTAAAQQAAAARRETACFGVAISMKLVFDMQMICFPMMITICTNCSCPGDMNTIFLFPMDLKKQNFQ
jgi:hypothetical protein